MPTGSPRSGVPGGGDPVTRDPAAGHEPAQELGAQLRSAREAAGLRIDDVAARTRIRATVVRAMEAGDFSPCGGHVYARGHLRSLAAAVGAEPDAFLDAYDRMSGQTDTAVRTPTGPEVADVVSADAAALRGLGGERARPVSTWLIAAVVAAAVLAVIVGVSVVRGGSGPSSPAARTAGPAVSSSLPATSPRPQPSQTVAYAGVNVTVNVRGSASWMNVRDDAGDLVFQGTVPAGASKDFHATQLLKFVFGYAPAISLSVNGKDIGQPPISGSDVSTVSIDANTATNAQLG